MIKEGSDELERMLKAADLKDGPRRLSMAGTRHRLPFFIAFRGLSAAALGLVVLAATLIAPQALFDVDRGLIGAFVGVGRHSLGFEQGA